MNTRIQELMQKAQVEVRVSIDPHTFRQYPDPNGPHTTIEFSAEKFAELIIKECGQVAWRHTPDSEELDYSHLIRDKILEHFGVE
jgi:hypothetical protein